MRIRVWLLHHIWHDWTYVWRTRGPDELPDGFGPCATPPVLPREDE